MTRKLDTETRLRRLLLEARDAISAELEAAGYDEVKQHPALRAKDRLLSRIDRALTDTPTGEPK